NNANGNTAETEFDIVALDSRAYTIVSTRTLDADGADTGLDTYDLIRDFGGPNPIEAPDLYEENHPGTAHIYEALDPLIGEHFVFTIHRDLDIDRDRLEITDRQRNEIKSYGSSEDAVKGYEGQTFLYRWKFRINSEMEVSTRFSHFFQLKAVGGDDSQPIITISGAERSGEDGIEVRFSPQRETVLLAREPWNLVTGEWLEVYCRATFSEDGDFRMIAVRLSDNQIVFDIDETALDFWRGEGPDDFVRPKWGIYRSILDAENLRPEEENVRFANFRVERIEFD
ncbi:MAG: dystroglycan-type cadherin-like protein, partial [Myxococcota bacterium]